MKKLKYILFFLILMLSPKAFAATYNVTSKVEAIPNFGGGTYGGYAKGIALPTYYNINTRYNGQLAMLDFYLSSDDWDWNYNKTYTITLNMATEDWRNNFMGPQVFSAQTNGNTTGSNLYVSNTFRFVSYKQIKFNFKLGSSLGPYLKFRLYSTNTNTTNITGVNNWRLSSISISDVSATPTPTSVTPTPTPSSGASNQDIINNNNNNTQSIINNNNSNTESIIDNNTQNTTDIINNNNSNTDKIVEQLSDCKNNLFNASAYTSSNFNDTQVSDNNINATATQTWKTISYNFDVEEGETYTLHYKSDTTGATFYRSSGSQWIQLNNDSFVTFVADSSNLEIRLQNSSMGLGIYNWSELMLVKGSVSTFIPFGSPVCSNKLDQTTDAINQQNDYLMDNSDPNISDNDFLNTFNSVGVNDPLSYLLTLPTQLINKIVSLSDTCSTINLGTLYGVMISLPCINLENILGSSVWNIIDVIFSVSLLVVIFKNFYDTFSNLLTMGAEKEAKEKFSMPTPMDFLSMILGGDR